MCFCKTVFHPFKYKKSLLFRRIFVSVILLILLSVSEITKASDSFTYDEAGQQVTYTTQKGTITTYQLIDGRLVYGGQLSTEKDLLERGFRFDSNNNTYKKDSLVFSKLGEGDNYILQDDETSVLDTKSIDSLDLSENDKIILKDILQKSDSTTPIDLTTTPSTPTISKDDVSLSSYTIEEGGNSLVDAEGKVVARRGEDGLFRDADTGEFYNEETGKWEKSQTTLSDQIRKSQEQKYTYDMNDDVLIGEDKTVISRGDDGKFHNGDQVYNEETGKWEKELSPIDEKTIEDEQKAAAEYDPYGDQKDTLANAGKGSDDVDKMEVGTVITQNAVQYILLIMEANEGKKTKNTSKRVSVKADKMQKSQGKQNRKPAVKIIPSDDALGNTPIEATTVAGASNAMIQLLNMATIDLTLLSEEVKDPEAPDQPPPPSNVVGVQDGGSGTSLGSSTVGGTAFASTTNATPVSTTTYVELPSVSNTTTTSQETTAEDNTLSNYKRDEIAKRRSLLMAEWAVAATNIGEGSNAISNQFYERAQLFVDAANAAQGSLGGASAINDTDRFVLFELTRGAALSAVQLGLKGSEILNEVENN